jgi:cysteine desulfuration protein SufE
MDIAARQQAVIDEFSAIADWEERYRRIIEYGRELAPMDEQNRTDKNKVKGCQSTVWMHAALDNGRMKLQGDSDAMIVRGLIAVLHGLYSGLDARGVLAVDAAAELGRLGLDQHLSSQRSNGLRAMVARLRDIAQSALEQA